MKLAFATMPRSGSEFAVKLARLVLDDLAEPVTSITPGRFIETPSGKSSELKSLLAQGEATQYFRQETLKYVKIESPGNDTLCWDLAAYFPAVKWIASIRSIEEIITSHFNIKTWGWSEQKILNAYIHDLPFYEYIASKQKLYIVNINEPEHFDLHKMLAFFDKEHAGPRTADFIKNWYVVNPVQKQQMKAGEEVVSEKLIPPNLSTLRARHPWLDHIERRYRHLWEACSLADGHE